MELIALIKKIDELKELMIASNVTHVEITRYRQWNDDEFVDNFETSIHQDDLDRPWNRTRDYYSRRG